MQTRTLSFHDSPPNIPAWWQNDYVTRWNEIRVTTNKEDEIMRIEVEIIINISSFEDPCSFDRRWDEINATHGAYSDIIARFRAVYPPPARETTINVAA